MKPLLLIKNVNLYAPEHMGMKDILICNEKVIEIQPEINPDTIGLPCEIIDGENAAAVPGYVDQHVHITGGGGEAGFYSRVPEIMLSEITSAGVTTVIGVLGTDGTSRSHESLLAKAKGLEEEGLTAYIMTGSYEYPLKTITGDARKDIILMDKVIGIGEVAVSDYRSSEMTYEEFKRTATQAFLGGMLSGKCSPLHLHMGSGQDGLKYLFRLIDETDIPASRIIPTHVNRSASLFKEAMEYAKKGGYIDITTGVRPESGFLSSISLHEGLKVCINNNVPIDKITMSSDGNGSMSVPQKNGKAKLLTTKLCTLHEEVRIAVTETGIPLETVLKLCTVNPAKAYGLYPSKGCIRTGSDADILLLDNDMYIDSVIAKGQFHIRNKNKVLKGTFEN